MNIPKDNNDLIDSPLHQLEIQMTNARRADSRNSNNGQYYSNKTPGNIDRESIYSFDSVSTNGRLLDRLGLDNEDYYEDNDISFGLSQRDSVISVQSTGRLLDRLEIDDNELAMAVASEPTIENKPRISMAIQDKHKPIFANSSTNSERVPLNKKNFVIQRPQIANNIHRNTNDRNVSIENRPRFKTSPVKVALPNQNHSVDSFQADIVSVNSSPSSNNNSDDQNFQTLVPNQPFPNEMPLFTGNSPAKKKSSLYIKLPTDQSILAPRVFPKAKSISHKHDHVQRGAPVREKLDETNDADDECNFSSSESMDEIFLSSSRITKTPPLPKIPHPTIIRSASTSATTIKTQMQNSSNGVVSDSSSPSTPLPTGELSPNSRTQSVIKLRKMGKDREASYQLRIAASPPYNFPKAMYLYGVALKFGQGVKQNNRHSLKWFCKCILIDTQPTNVQYASKLNDLEPEDMISLINKELEHDNHIDPNELYEYYSMLQPSQLTKIVNISKSQLDVVSASYHEVGIALVNGFGLSNKNEMIGIAYFSKAGSMGFINSMVQLGDILCSKSKYHKKDYYKAASWLRLSEIFGVKTIGNSWIYKNKYMPSKLKNKH